MTSEVSSRSGGTRKFLVALCLSAVLHGILILKVGSIPHEGMREGRLQLRINLFAQATPRTEASESLASVPSPTSAQEKALPAQERDISARENTVPRASSRLPKSAPLGHVISAPTSNTAPSSQELPQPSPLSGTNGGASSGAARHVEIEFDILSGPDRESIGSGRHRYVSDDDYYSVSVEKVSKNGEGTLGDAWKMEVSGRIGGQGLSPVLFQMQGEVSERLMALKEGFVGVHKQATNTIRKGRIRDGILDRQSLLYHFMFHPPELTGGDVMLTDGVNLELFSYRVAGVEVLDTTALGSVQTLKLALSTRESGETIEFWLVPGSHHLPVKIRHVDRHGVVTEQIVVKLNFE